MNYNEENRHQRDSRIHFDEASHTYTLGDTVFQSVTRVVERCFEQFDADYWAEIKAPGMGLTPEELKAQWALNGEKARNLGSQMHAKIEHYYLGEPLDYLTDTDALFQQFVDQHHLCPYRTEWAIYDEDSHVAGMLDFLDFQNGDFTIYDWKRSNKIIVNGFPETESRWGKTAFAPIAHIPDTTYWHYALQLSMYRYILEKNYGITVRANRLVVLHPSYSTPHVVEVPYLREEVKTLLNAVSP
ncbi:MAG: hypothetical protein IKX39_01820 [Muribaculaceae bacterium]|nr:hypothetical protein [Muribaculaceae bacterium]